MSATATTPTDSVPRGPHELTNLQLLRRMLGLGWRYRWGCLWLLTLQGLLLATGLGGLGLTRGGN